MAMVFISYAKDDSSKIDALEAAFEASGVTVWRDKSQLSPGAEHWRQIESEIEKARALVLCCSAASLTNKNVLKEVAFAESREIPLLTIALEPPRSLRQPIEIIGKSLEDLSQWGGDVLDPSYLKLLSGVGEAAGDEKLKRRHSDWVAEQRDKEEAQKRAAAAKEAAEATERRVAAEAAAKTKSDFKSGQEALWQKLPIQKTVRSAAANVGHCEETLAKLERQSANDGGLAFVREHPSFTWAGIFWLFGPPVFIASQQTALMYLWAAGVCVWGTVAVIHIISFALTGFNRLTLAARVAVAKGALANAQERQQETQRVAKEAWLPFEQVIEQFDKQHRN